SKVVTVQASNPGKILTLNVQVGARVTKGQVLATIDQSELQKQLQLSRDKLAQLRLQDQTAKLLQTQRYGLEASAIAKQKETLEKSLETLESLTPELRRQVQEVIKRERQNLQQRLKTLQDLLPTYYQRWQKRKNLFKQGAVPQDIALQAQQDYKNAQTQINEAKSQLHQLDLKQTDAERQYMNNLNQVNELQAKLKALESRQANQQEQDSSTANNRKKEIQDTERLIAQLKLQLKNSSQILSDYTGTVLEITAKPGQQLEPGAGIGTIAQQESSAKLVNVAFLPVSEGKKIKSGMSLQITPSNVKREEFGGIEGKVTKVSAFPITQKGAASLIGN
ncbi:MAG: NHLP bacteriocin system secretion protein, partial [Cyanobacteria bacterium P01_D01_bin.116]